MDAYAYIRFSTPRQEKGDSLRRQTDDVTGFCARQGWPIVETIQDLGQSAWTGAHLRDGNLGKFAERVRRGEISLPAVLVVERLDRLSRQEARVTQRWMEDLTELGLAIATVDGARVYTDASLRADLMGTFEILMRAQLAHQESEQKSKRVLDSIGARMEKAKKTDQKITAKTPGWLVLNEDRRSFTMIEERVKVVRDIYAMAAAGQGARWIAKTLNERLVAAWGPPRKDGKRRTWEISSVKLILAQPAVEGDYHPGFANTSKKRTQFKEPILGYYPRVVDADLVARARAAVEARRTGPRKAPTGEGTGGRHIGNVANLFAGLVRCGECGNRMHLRSNGDRLPKRYLHCNHASRRRGCDQRAMFAYDPLEQAALDEVLHLALSDKHFARVDETGALTVALAEADKAISDRKSAHRRLVKLATLVDDGEDEEIAAQLSENRKAITALEEQRKEVEAHLDAARGAVSPEEHLARVRDLRGALSDSDPATRQAARLRVQAAMKGLGLSFTCSVKANGERRTLLTVATGAACEIAQDGTIMSRWDIGALDRPDVEGLPAALLAKVMAPIAAPFAHIVPALAGHALGHRVQPICEAPTDQEIARLEAQMLRDWEDENEDADGVA